MADDLGAACLESFKDVAASHGHKVRALRASPVSLDGRRVEEGDVGTEDRTVRPVHRVDDEAALEPGAVDDAGG
jgi:hypothetical protein